MLLFVAAEAREFTGLLQFCTEVAIVDLAVRWARSGNLHGNRILMIANGAGARQAALAVDRSPEVTGIVSTGFCGALDPSLQIGDIFVASSVEGRPTLMPESQRHCASGALASIDHVAQTAAEKRKLRSAGAAAVEMEAAGVAERARTRGLPFFCVRSVTDLAEENFANDLNRALRADGHFDTMQILMSAMRRPAVRLPELVRLSKRCRFASGTLGEFLADCRF
jgi:adenosylhomocysteine nucleosidase